MPKELKRSPGCECVHAVILCQVMASDFYLEVVSVTISEL